MLLLCIPFMVNLEWKIDAIIVDMTDTIANTTIEAINFPFRYQGLLNNSLEYSSFKYFAEIDQHHTYSSFAKRRASEKRKYVR